MSREIDIAIHKKISEQTYLEAVVNYWIHKHGEYPTTEILHLAMFSRGYIMQECINAKPKSREVIGSHEEKVYSEGFNDGNDEYQENIQNLVDAV